MLALNPQDGNALPKNALVILLFRQYLALPSNHVLHTHSMQIVDIDILTPRALDAEDISLTSFRCR